MVLFKNRGRQVTEKLRLIHIFLTASSADLSGIPGLICVYLPQYEGFVFSRQVVRDKFYHHDDALYAHRRKQYDRQAGNWQKEKRCCKIETAAILKS